MLESQRHENALKYLAHHDFLSVEKAVELFDASMPTIRRDFNKLAEKKLAKRLRGGLQSLKQSSSAMTPFALRQFHNSAEKEALAREAVKMLEPGKVILVDGGTTTFCLGLVLPDIELRVITNSVRLAAILEEKSEEHSKLEISLTGGLLYKKSGILLGPHTESSVEQYHADIAFLSVGGINESGIYNTNELVTETERVMIRNADKIVVLADRSKIGKKAMCHVAGIDDIDILITNDYPANNGLLLKLEEAGLNIIRTA